VQARLIGWSLRQRRWRHVLDAIAIALTTAVVMVFVALLGDLVRFTHASLGAPSLSRILVVPAIVTPGTTTDGHPAALYATLAKIPGIKVVQRKRVIFGRHESGATYLVSGEEDSGVELNKDYFPADAATIDAWKRERPLGAIVSEATAKDLGLQIGVVTEIPTSAGPLKIKPVAFSHGATFPHSMAVHFEYLQEATKNQQTCGFRVFTAPADVGHVLKDIKTLTENSGAPAHGISSERFQAGIARRASAIPTVLGFLGAFLIFTTVLTLANNRSISVRERRTEVATLRVIGYRRRSILAMLIGESLVVSIIGGAIAIAVVWFAFRNGVQLTKGSISLVRPVHMDAIAIACGAAAAILVPLAGALLPALGATRVELAQGLRDTA